MLKNGELAYCKDCGNPSTAEMDEDYFGPIAICGVCGSPDLMDMSDGGRFVPDFEGEEYEHLSEAD